MLVEAGKELRKLMAEPQLLALAPKHQTSGASQIVRGAAAHGQDGKRYRRGFKLLAVPKAWR